MQKKYCGVCKEKKHILQFEALNKGVNIEGVLRESTKKRQDICMSCQKAHPEEATLRKVQLGLSRNGGLRNRRKAYELDTNREKVYLFDYYGSAWNEITIEQAEQLLAHELSTLYNSYILINKKPAKAMKQNANYKRIMASAKQALVTVS